MVPELQYPYEIAMCYEQIAIVNVHSRAMSVMGFNTVKSLYLPDDFWWRWADKAIYFALGIHVFQIFYLPVKILIKANICLFIKHDRDMTQILVKNPYRV